MDSAELKPMVSTSNVYLEKVRQLIEVSREAKRLAKIESTLKDEFRDYMGERPELHLQGYRVQKQAGINTGLDAAKVRQYLSEEAYAKCVRSTSYTKIIVTAL